MQKSSTPLFIYVSGPYSPQVAYGNEREQVIENIRKANEVALEIVAIGHYPFVPHTMMQHWEDQFLVPRNRVIEMSLKWVEKCDALFYMSSSVGADLERAHADSMGMPIYYAIEDIPPVVQYDSIE